MQGFGPIFRRVQPGAIGEMRDAGAMREWRNGEMAGRKSSCN
jgi:hypothetical protein